MRPELHHFALTAKAIHEIVARLHPEVDASRVAVIQVAAIFQIQKAIPIAGVRLADATDETRERVSGLNGNRPGNLEPIPGLQMRRVVVEIKRLVVKA